MVGVEGFKMRYTIFRQRAEAEAKMELVRAYSDFWSAAQCLNGCYSAETLNHPGLIYFLFDEKRFSRAKTPEGITSKAPH